LTLASPGHVLGAVIGQHFFRRTIRADSRLEGFQHQRGRGTGMDLAMAMPPKVDGSDMSRTVQIM
jgi:hypothetical protein